MAVSLSSLALIMNNITLTLIQPSFLGKLKPFQNLSLIITCTLLLIAFTLSWFDSNILSNIAGYLVALSLVPIITFILLSLPFFFFKRLEIATITNRVMSIDINNKPAQFDIQELKFLLNIDSKLLENKEPLNSEIIKDLSTWGNYIVIPCESPLEDIYIQFIPGEDLLKVLPQLKIETKKNSSILMNDTTDLLKKFMWMLWGAS